MDGVLNEVIGEPNVSNGFGKTRNGFNKNNYPIPMIPLEIDDTKPEEGAAELLSHIRPDWSQNDIKYTTFTAGYTNILIGCSLCSGDPADTILVRIYGRGTDLMINRQHERNSMVVLHTVGCAAPVFCRFKNGIAYGYKPGIAIDSELVQQPNVIRLVIEQMVRMHAVDMESVCATFGNGLHFEMQPALFRTMYSWLEHVPERFSDADKQAKLDKLGFTKTQFQEEIQCLEDNLTPLNSPVVFCHNDLLPKNIVYDEERQKVYFIDFEYVSYNYQAFDIANHFCEYAGMVDMDYSLYPGRKYQLNWLRIFLETSFAHRSLEPTSVTDIDVERLYIQVQKFSLASHLFWAFWALIQARHSSKHYDYLDFAFARMTEYKKRKNEFLSLEMPS